MIGSLHVLILAGGKAVHNKFEAEKFIDTAAIRRAEEVGIPPGKTREKFCDDLRANHREELYWEGKSIIDNLPTPFLARFLQILGTIMLLAFIWFVYLTIKGLMSPIPVEDYF
jgi:hypothetical protein